MLNLSLREEFRSARLKGTVVELTDDRSTGAVQVAPPQFLDITYPTHDVLKAIEAVNEGQGRPVVVIGERGLGKSHILAVLHHTLNDPPAVRSWLASWKDTIEPSTLDAIKLRSTKMHVITESLHNHRIKNLWDLFAVGHPASQFFEGSWGGRTDVPPKETVIETLKKCPTALILDEFQTWFDGLTNLLLPPVYPPLPIATPRPAFDNLPSGIARGLPVLGEGGSLGGSLASESTAGVRHGKMTAARPSSSIPAARSGSPERSVPAADL